MNTHRLCERFLTGMGLSLALAATVPALAQTKTLKMVAQADLKVLDPTFGTAYISRSFGYMVYDTEVPVAFRLPDGRAYAALGC